MSCQPNEEEQEALLRSNIPRKDFVDPPNAPIFYNDTILAKLGHITYSFNPILNTILIKSFTPKLGRKMLSTFLD